MTPNSVLSAEQSKKLQKRRLPSKLHPRSLQLQRNPLLRRKSPQRPLNRQLRPARKPNGWKASRKSFSRHLKPPEKLCFPPGKIQIPSLKPMPVNKILPVSIAITLVNSNSIISSRHLLHISSEPHLLANSRQLISSKPHLLISRELLLHRKRKEAYSAGF